MYLCEDRGKKSRPDTQGCGENQALDFRVMDNFHDLLSGKKRFLEIQFGGKK
jgi:hypothetical protein